MRTINELAEEWREARIAAGLSQQEVADGAHIARSYYSRIERGKVASLSILVAARISAVLGLDMWFRTYPGGTARRDAAHGARLQRVLNNTRPPLGSRTEVGLPQRADQPTELRAWDAVLYGGGERTAIEMEMRIRDGQALERRLALKRRDDQVDHFLLVLADTRTNRQVIAEDPELFAPLTRLRTATVLKILREGRHPPSGFIFI